MCQCFLNCSCVMAFFSQQYKRHWLNLLTASSVGSCFSSRYVSCSARCLCDSCIRWNVLMTSVVLPLSALVMTMSLLVLRLWIARLLCVLRFGARLTILLWALSCIMPSKRQSKSLHDLAVSLYLVLCLSHKVSIIAWRSVLVCRSLPFMC